MPGGDRTGPMGQGAMTGRRAGYCTGANTPGFQNPAPGGGGFGGGWGRGFGGRGRGGGRGLLGRGGGRGWRHGYHATGQPGWMRFAGAGPAASGDDSEQEQRRLRERARALQAELDQIQTRLKDSES